MTENRPQRLSDGKGEHEQRVVDNMNDLSRYRQQHGLSETGSVGDADTVAKMVVGENDFYGVNRGLQTPKANITMRINAQTKQHAEAHAAQQVIDAGLKGKFKMAEQRSVYCMWREKWDWVYRKGDWGR